MVGSEWTQSVNLEFNNEKIENKERKIKEKVKCGMKKEI